MYEVTGLALIVAAVLIKHFYAGENEETNFMVCGGLFLLLTSLFLETDFWDLRLSLSITKTIMVNICQFIAWFLVSVGIVSTCIKLLKR